MICSHKHRFIFLKTRKTAGSSIEAALSKIAGDDAIVTPLSPAEPGHRPRNFKATTSAGPVTRAERNRLFLEGSVSHDLHNYMPYFSHMPAWLARQKLGHRVWDGYFKFCFERNPWDKVISMYSWRVRDLTHPPSFSEWLTGGKRISATDWSIYSIDDVCAVDAIGRYEFLETDLGDFLQRVGLSIDGPLPHAKGDTRRPGILYQPNEIEYVRKQCWREVELLNYAFPSELRSLDMCEEGY